MAAAAFTTSCAASAVQPPARSTSFYEHSIAAGVHRIENGALVRQPFRSEPQVMDQLAWIEGEWSQTNIVLAVNSIPAKTTEAGTVRFSIDRGDMAVHMQSTREGSRRHRVAFYDPYAERWVSVADMRWGYGVMTAAGWQDARLDLTGPVTFMGRTFVMRHALVRTGPDSFEIQNSEQLPDGSWRMFDKHVYRRRPLV